MGTPLFPPKKGAELPPKNFRPMFIVPNGSMDQDRTWHGGASQPRRPCGVRWGSSPLPKKGAEPLPQFSAHFYCGQTAGCIKMPLGMDVGLNPGYCVLDGEQYPSPTRGRTPPTEIFGPCFLWPTAGWIKMPLGMAVGLVLRDIVFDGDPATHYILQEELDTGFPTSHQPRFHSAPNFIKMGINYLNLSSFWTISTIKDEKSAAKFHYIKTVSGKVVAQSNCLSSGINILAGVGPFP